MVKALRAALSAALALALLNLTPAFLAPAHAAPCSITTGSTPGGLRYVIVDSGSGCTWSVPTGVTSMNYFAVGGGGGGGGARAAAVSPNLGGGGGGAGGIVLASTMSTSAGTTFTLTVGSGGSGGAASSNGGNGGATTISYSSTTLTANGGGGGAGSSGSFDQANLSGDGGANSSYSGGANDWDGGGGGAGSAANGSNGIDIGGQGGTGGAGGTGTLTSILGTSAYYGGGGGGGGTPATNSGETNGFGGSGGSSVGGNGGGGAGTLPTAGVANTGSGGGGGGWRSTSSDADRAGAAGASGRIIFTFSKSAATISTISITSNSGADNTYSIGNSITVSVSTSEAITVSGSPRIPVLGLSSKYFTYSSGSGTTTLLFTYSVALNDTASAGAGITANTLELNSGSLLDSVGVAMTLTHSAVSQSLSHKVDGIRPTVSYTASNNVPENESKTVTLLLSEPGTITLSSNFDRSHVTFDTATNIVTFAPHDFENKQDSDANNQYYVSFTIADSAGNVGANTYNLFFTVTNVTEPASIGTPTLSSQAVKGVATTITVTVDMAGKVDFFWNGKRIPGCLARSTTGTSPNITATCSWKPVVMAQSAITARIRPTDTSFTARTSDPISVLPVLRTTRR